MTMTSIGLIFRSRCVIAELFTEGGGMFRLAELFKYRELGGDVSKMPELEGRLNAIKDTSIRVRQTPSQA
jgi:hypothetical protein